MAVRSKQILIRDNCRLMPGPCVDRCKSLKNLGSFKISEKGFALYQTLKTAVFNRGGEGGTRPALQVIEDGRKPVKKKD